MKAGIDDGARLKSEREAWRRERKALVSCVRALSAKVAERGEAIVALRERISELERKVI